jgi:hypothetical protein
VPAAAENDDFYRDFQQTWALGRPAQGKITMTAIDTRTEAERRYDVECDGSA